MTDHCTCSPSRRDWYSGHTLNSRSNVIICNTKKMCLTKKCKILQTTTVCVYLISHYSPWYLKLYTEFECVSWSCNGHIDSSMCAYYMFVLFSFYELSECHETFLLTWISRCRVSSVQPYALPDFILKKLLLPLVSLLRMHFRIPASSASVNNVHNSSTYVQACLDKNLSWKAFMWDFSFLHSAFANKGIVRGFMLLCDRL